VLRTEWYCAAALAVTVLACNPSSPIPLKAGSGPKVRATAVTIRTTLQPSNEISEHAIVIGPEMARDTSEAPQWRLFDFQRNRVLFVDDVTRTYRAESLQSLLKRHQRKPDADLDATPETREILGVKATRIVIRRGAYQRDVWLGEHPAIPPQLFSLMEASEERPSHLRSARGFPLLDHAEVPYGKSKLVSERAVVSVAPRDVERSLLEIPQGYRDTTAASD
jgi:hypothetical protein